MERVSINISDHVADIQLNRPDKMNALDTLMFDAIIEAGEEVAANKEVRCVVLSGKGKAFCAGLDLGNFVNNNDDSVTKSKLIVRTHGIANKFQKAATIWREMPMPVVAAIHGVSFGGGLQIMLGSDIRIIDPDTKLAIMEMKWGLVPDMAGTQLMRGLIRDDVIRELTYTNRIFSGKEAVEYGFATRLSATPYEEAIKLAGEIALKNPDALRGAKSLLNKAQYLSFEEGLLLESAIQDPIIGSKNQLEAVFSQMQKRKGLFDNHR